MGRVAKELRLHSGMPAHLAKQFEQSISSDYYVTMDDAPDVSGGGSTAQVSFTVLRRSDGNPVEFEFPISFGIYTDQYRTTPATTAQANVNTATTGDFLAGDGQPGADVKTDSAGRFVCTLSRITAGLPVTFFIGCTSLHIPADSRSTDSITFSA